MEQLLQLLWMVALLIIFFGTIITHVAFAFTVLNSAAKRSKKKQPVVLVPAEIWGIATLVFGIFAAAFYWAAHESTLAHKSDSP